MSSSTGTFIAFEGGDGAGKSTQAGLLAEAFRADGHTVVLTRQPGGTPLGAAVRDLLLHGDHVSARAEALLFAADKAQHVDTVIRPALERGEVVITDRYTDSAVAYQGAGRELGAADVHELQMWAVDSLVPHLTLLIDVPPDEGRRRRDDAGDRLEAERDSFHEATRAHFAALAEAAADRYAVIDGTRTVDEVHTEVLERVREAGLWGPPALARPAGLLGQVGRLRKAGSSLERSP